MSKKERTKLAQAMTKWLYNNGAKASDNRLGYTWEIETEAGLLYVIIDSEGSMVNVFTRFEEPDRAKALVDCNPYSGKWNFHFDKVCAYDTCLEYFIGNMEKVLMKKEMLV